MSLGLRKLLIFKLKLPRSTFNSLIQTSFNNWSLGIISSGILFYSFISGEENNFLFPSDCYLYRFHMWLASLYIWKIIVNAVVQSDSFKLTERHWNGRYIYKVFWCIYPTGNKLLSIYIYRNCYLSMSPNSATSGKRNLKDSKTSHCRKVAVHRSTVNDTTKN